MGKFDNNENLISLIKSTPVNKLQDIADRLRAELIDDVSVSGGHLASNLGVVELTVALHKVFDSPKDKIVWDVGHQCYVHKMITGRKEEMRSIRSFGGISGFPKRSESEHDMYDSGHSGTSISAALGYAAARDLKGEDYSCIAVIGDGALTGGVAFEALNNAGALNTPLIVILNDNQMSIGSSVGSTPGHLSRLRTSDTYLKLKESLKKTKMSAPGLYRFLRTVRDVVKYIFVPNQIFEDLGFKYYGPLDGHDIEEMVKALEFAKSAKRPIVLHVITKKGMGFAPAEDNPEKFHGIGSFDKTKISSENVRSDGTWSDVFGDELLKIAEKDDKVVAVSAAMVSATGLRPMQEKMPERVFDVGIAEQHAVSFAAGLALNGLKPVVAIYSTFLQRAYDQIITEVCLQNLPVVFAIDRAGVTGPDGETHQGVFDISYLNAMPNMTILSARDETSFRACIDYAVRLGTPCAVRYGKGNIPKPSEKIEIDNNYVPGAVTLKDGSEDLIICDGSFADSAIYAAEKCPGSVAVIDLEMIKPLDNRFIRDLVNTYKHIVTVEDGVICGGMGSEIALIASEAKYGAKVLCLGWPDKFIEHGSIQQLREKYGMDKESIAKAAEEFFEDKA